MTRFDFAFPDCPQRDQLLALVERLSNFPEVVEIWLGGSFAAGNADRYSDVDLRISIASETLKDWKAPNLSELFLDHCPGVISMIDSDKSALHHVVLSDGEIFDFYVQRFPPPFVEEQIIPIASRFQDFQAKPTLATSNARTEKTEVNAIEIERAIRNFWINTHKHRKVLNRDLDLLVHVGLQFERDFLRRLWTLVLTGNDEPQSKTIHTLTTQVRTISDGIGKRAYTVLGMPMQSRSQLIAAIEAVRTEVALTGRDISHTIGFEYPVELEAVVLSGWNDWKLNNPVCDSEFHAVELMQ